jgi:hypothetical protein
MSRASLVQFEPESFARKHVTLQEYTTSKCSLAFSSYRSLMSGPIPETNLSVRSAFWIICSNIATSIDFFCFRRPSWKEHRFDVLVACCQLVKRVQTPTPSLLPRITEPSWSPPISLCRQMSIDLVLPLAWMLIILQGHKRARQVSTYTSLNLPFSRHIA